MKHDPGAPIVVADGYWMHIRHTRIHHRHYPEVQGEGASVAAAAAHLSRQLARAVDLAHGREVCEAIMRALADVHAFRSNPPVQRPPCRDGGESRSVVPRSKGSL